MGDYRSRSSVVIPFACVVPPKLFLGGLSGANIQQAAPAIMSTKDIAQRQNYFPITENAARTVKSGQRIY